MANETVLIFSRGKGRGHAVPDVAIAAALRQLRPSIEVEFASYAVGAETLRQRGESVIDLRLPEEPPLADVAGAAARVVSSVKDRARTLVVSHEEFGAVPIAKALRVRSVVFMADWLPRADTPHWRRLMFADEIVILDDAGLLHVPQSLTVPLTYVGRVHGRHAAADERGACERCASRKAQGFVLLVAPGGNSLHSERRTPMWDLVVSAFDLLPLSAKKLIWIVSDDDEGLLRHKARGRRDLELRRSHDSFMCTLAGASVVITKANRVTTFEAEAVMVPSISVSFGVNAIDDERVASIANNTALWARSLGSEGLAQHIVAASRRRQAKPVDGDSDPPTAVAARLAFHLDR